MTEQLVPLAGEAPVVGAPGGGAGASVASTRRKRPMSLDRLTMLLVFVGVPFAGYVVFVLYPFGQAAWFSLTSWSGFSAIKPFVGLDNYVALAGDPVFLRSVRNSIIMALVLPVTTLVLAFVLAMFLTVGGSTRGQVRGLRGSAFYRVVSFFPYVMPAIVVGIIWAQIYDPSRGLLNGVLAAVGLDQFEQWAWLGERSTAMAATLAVIVWAFVGFYMVLFVAAIQGIDTELFEAARLDGAGRWRTATAIILPSISGNIRSSYIYMGITALDAFVFVQAFNPGGGPNNSTLVITQQIYQTAFTRGQFGLACAMGVVMAALTFAFVGLVSLVTRLTRRSDA